MPKEQIKKKEKNTSEILVECLGKHGVKYIFGVPGEENLTFLEAVRNSKIIFITTRHEQAAAFMASTFGRMTGKIGVALSTLGPGATNLLTGVAYAQLGGFPLLLITGQKAIKKSKQGKFQIVDIVSVMKPITKYSASIVSANRVATMAHDAIRLAETERPGAVHLELPEDIAEEICHAKPFSNPQSTKTLASPKAIALALGEIEKSKHPLIILGAGANRQPIRHTFHAFLKKTGIPFVSTQMGKGSANENSPLYIGTTALSGGDYVHQALHHADVVIVIGHDVIEKPPIILNGKSCKVIHVHFYPSSFKDIYVPTHEVIGDIINTLQVFTRKIKINPAWDFNYFLKVRDVLKKDIANFTQSAEFPLRPERIIADLGKVLPKDGMLTLDNGMYKLWIARNFKSRAQNSILLDNALATMGAGLPAGIALKILYPNKQVIVVAGDGGIMMSLGDLETAVRLKINLVVLILDDKCYGMIEWKQKNMKLASFGLSFNNPDFVMLAKSFGATGYKVRTAENLAKILAQTLNTKGVHIIACPINYDKANAILGSIKNKKV